MIGNWTNNEHIYKRNDSLLLFFLLCIFPFLFLIDWMVLPEKLIMVEKLIIFGMRRSIIFEKLIIFGWEINHGWACWYAPFNYLWFRIVPGCVLFLCWWDILKLCKVYVFCGFCLSYPKHMDPPIKIFVICNHMEPNLGSMSSKTFGYLVEENYDDEDTMLCHPKHMLTKWNVWFLTMIGKIIWEEIH